MQHVDAHLVNTDLQARVDYLAKFIEFGPEDVEALHNATPVVKPFVGAAVDAVWQLAEKLEDINHNSEQIKFRKDFLKVWVVKVFTADYSDPKTFEYLDRVGIMHTGKAGFKHREKKDPLFVDYAHCAILLGYVQSMLTSAVMARDDLPDEVKTATLLAINKVMWIQNDLFARHYIPSSGSKAPAKTLGVDGRVWPAICGGLAITLAYLLWA
ncbi:Protoglobin, partial [Rhizoctonia solani]